MKWIVAVILCLAGAAVLCGYTTIRLHPSAAGARAIAEAVYGKITEIQGNDKYQTKGAREHDIQKTAD